MHKICISCEQEITDTSKFCCYCGSIQTKYPIADVNLAWDKLKQAGLFYAIEVFCCLAFCFYKPVQNLWGLIGFNVVTISYTLVFINLNKQLIKPVISWQKLSWQKLTLYSCIAFVSAMLVNYASGWLNHNFFSGDTNYYTFFAGYKYVAGLLILFTAIMPALFEEVAYRGYLLQVLFKVVDKQQAIFISSFLFAIIHLNFLSLFWLLPFALFLGYVCSKEKTIWYGVLFHFLFNLTTCFLELA